MSRSLINICTQAARQLKKLSSQSSQSSVFIGVKGGGCNGLKYVVEPLQEAPSEIDEKVKIEVYILYMLI